MVEDLCQRGSMVRVGVCSFCHFTLLGVSE
jgi:hypothetical protein